MSPVSAPALRSAGRRSKLGTVMVALVVAVAAGACEPPSAFPDLDADLAPMGLLPISAGAPPAGLTPEEVFDKIAPDYPGGMEPLRIGRRWVTPPGRSVWVAIFGLPPDPACPGCSRWAGRVVDDRSGEVLFAFDEGSMRAFGMPLPDW